MLALFDPARASYLPTLQGFDSHLNTAFGLVFRTPFPCPELFPAPGRAPDVRVAYAPVPAVTRPVFNGTYNQIQFQDGTFTHNKTGVVRTWVRGGAEIRMQRVPYVHDDEVRYTFLTVVMTALLLQRGILPLHASAVSTARGAFLFVGRSGAGKSTLAAEMVRRGYLMQADDIAPIRLGAGAQPEVVAGFPQLKLCLDAAAHLDQPVQGTARVRPKEDKLSVLKHDRFRQAPSPLLGIVLLEPDARDDIAIRRLSSREKLHTLIEYTFNQSFLDGLNRRSEHFRQVAAVGNAIDAFAVRRPAQGYRLQELADRIETELFPHRKT